MIFRWAKTLAKWSWVGAALAFAGYYAVAKFNLIESTFAMLGPGTLLAATCAIILAKLCLSENMRLASGKAGLTLPLKDCYYIYNFTQLAKYIPGSIWQFVGRIAILRKRGVPPAEIRDALLAEQVWVIGTAMLLAISIIGVSQPDLIRHLTNKMGIGNAGYAWFLAMSMLLLAALAFVYLWRTIAKVIARLLLPPRGAVVMLLAWASLGTSFWITLGPFSEVPVPWIFTIGVYCLAYIAGFLVPFAPAGLGVREGVLALGMAAYLTPEMALLLAALNRGVYLLAEIILVIPCLAWYRRSVLPSQK